MVRGLRTRGWDQPFPQANSSAALFFVLMTTRAEGAAFRQRSAVCWRSDYGESAGAPMFQALGHGLVMRTHASRALPAARRAPAPFHPGKEPRQPDSPEFQGVVEARGTRVYRPDDEGETDGQHDHAQQYESEEDIDEGHRVRTPL